MASDEEPTVFIVDDDAAVRTSLARALTMRGYRAAAYDSAIGFLEATGGARPGCLILDVLMPDISGLELQERLETLHHHVPIIFVTGHGDVPTSVRAMKHGAFDFLEKPYSINLLVERIDQALGADALAWRAEKRARRIRTRHASLTDREREVFGLLTEGRPRSNKDIARILGISHRTVEVHRGRIMRKMHARSLTELLDMAETSAETEAGSRVASK